MDAISPARMIEEDPLFDGARVHFSILSEVNRSLSETVRLAAGVQAVHISLVLVGANVRIQEGRIHKTHERTQEKNKWNHGRIADSSHPPALSPSSQASFQRPPQEGKENSDDHREVENVLGDVMEYVVPHLMSHDR